MDQTPTNPTPPAKLVGPGSQPEMTEELPPLLEGATEYEVVEVFNPLSDDFAGQFGVTRPTTAPLSMSKAPNYAGMTQTPQDVATNYGVTTNPNHQAKANIVNTTIIPSGKTVPMLGSEAQVIVRQLVNEIMQREGKRLKLADAWERRQTEQRVVMSRRSLNQVLGTAPVSVHEQLKSAVNTLTEAESPHVEEQSFPGLQESNNLGDNGAADSGQAAAVGAPEFRAPKPRVKKQAAA